MKISQILCACLVLILGACQPKPKDVALPIPSSSSVADVDPSNLSADTLTTQVVNAQEPLDSMTLLAVGDVMTGSFYPDSMLPKTCEELFAGVVDSLKSADLSFANLEGALTSDTSTPKACTGRCYTFAMRPEDAGCLSNVGFDMVSIANNHAGDFGVQGRRNTKIALRDAGLAYAGQEPCEVTLLKVRSLRVGLLAFSPSAGTCDMNDSAMVQRAIVDASTKADIVVVSFHAGAEGRDAQRTPTERETYLGTNRGFVREFAHQSVDWGADVLIGHGPHVSRAVELYKGRLIAYSLGNFATWKRMKLDRETAWGPILKLKLDGNGALLGGQILSTEQSKTQGPSFDSKQNALRKIAELSSLDFPESPLLIDSVGKLTIKTVSP